MPPDCAVRAQAERGDADGHQGFFGSSNFATKIVRAVSSVAIGVIVATIFVSFIGGLRIQDTEFVGGNKSDSWSTTEVAQSGILKPWSFSGFVDTKPGDERDIANILLRKSPVQKSRRQRRKSLRFQEQENSVLHSSV